MFTHRLLPSQPLTGPPFLPSSSSSGWQLLLSSSFLASRSPVACDRGGTLTAPPSCQSSISARWRSPLYRTRLHHRSRVLEGSRAKDVNTSATTPFRGAHAWARKKIKSHQYMALCMEIRFV
jgi:hypothetical protein